MCRDCRHWGRHRARLDFGVRFAPCALMPDKLVKDSRNPSGLADQSYTASETYVCTRFERDTERNRGTS
jgi:hypothetical protein